jgi:trk system potassium uptake protein TrkA
MAEDIKFTRHAKKTNKPILVIGLGRFGSAVAKGLVLQGKEVLAIDNNEQLINQYSSVIHTIKANSTSTDALKQVGIDDFGSVIVGIGTNIEASVLTCGNLLDIGVEDVWAKAESDEHARILKRLGVHHIINPESQAGSRVAHQMSSNLLDYIEFEDDYTIAKIMPPRVLHGFTLQESRIRSKFGITVLGIKHIGEEFEPAYPSMKIVGDDAIIIAGSPDLVNAFAMK